MNILLINHYAGSKVYGMVYRPYYMSREFVRMGHHVTIVSASYTHLRTKNPVVKKDLDEEWIDGIRYLWLSTPSYEKSGLGRVKNILSFIWKLRKKENEIREIVHPDLVVASSTYNLEIYSAYRIAKKNKAKLCYEIRDLWPLTPKLIGGYSEKHPFIWAVQKAEDYAYSHSDKVVSLLWNAEAYCKEHGLAEGRFVCIPNGYDPEEWTDEKIHQKLPHEHQKAFEELEGSIIIGFAGGFAPSGTVITVLKSAVQLKHRKDIKFVLVGKGQEEANYRKYISDNNMDNVIILPAVKKELVPSLLSHFDIMPICGRHSPLHKYGTSPNKLTDCMLSATPIVYSIDEPSCLVERVGCGIRTEAENVAEMTEAFLRLYSMTPEERRAIGGRGKLYALENLKWSTLAQMFIDVFDYN